MELLTIYGDKAYYHDDGEGLLLAVPVVAEDVDFEGACEALVDRGLMEPAEGVGVLWRKYKSLENGSELSTFMDYLKQ